MIAGIFSLPRPYSEKGKYQVLCIKREDLAKTKGHFIFFPIKFNLYSSCCFNSNKLKLVYIA